MNELIYEAIVTTVSAAGVAHLAPMGVRYHGERVVLMPFKPSTTHDNIIATGHAVLNLTTDTRVFAGCVTGRKSWPLLPAEVIGHAARLADALAHQELRLIEHDADAQRPRLQMRCVHAATHAPFLGFNRAQAAVIEAAVLVSRLRMLPAAKIEAELRYLQIAIDKTAGPQELQAWGWLQEAVAAHRAASSAGSA